MSSHDLEDIVRVVDSRPELVEELDEAHTVLRTWVGSTLSHLFDRPLFSDEIRTHLPPDRVSQARVDTIILPRLRRLAELGKT